MKKKNLIPSVVPVLLGGVLALVTVPFAAAQAAKPQPAAPTRVRANLSGFDITPKSGRGPNQIGGVSRGVNGITLYAPPIAKAYTLTPTFSWSTDDPAAEFTFKLAMEGAGQNPVYEMKLTGGSFTYPASAPALMPGATYIYWVQPTVDLVGGPVTGSILIIGGTERASIAASLAKASTPAAKAKLYTDSRLWFDALAAYNNLIATTPKADYYQARADLYDQLPQTSALADADAAKAHK